MTPEAFAELLGRLLALMNQLEAWLPEAPRHRTAGAELWPLLLSGGFGAVVALGGTWVVQRQLLGQAERREERRTRQAEARYAADSARRELAPVLLQDLAWSWEERAAINPFVVARDRTWPGLARGVTARVFEGPHAPWVPATVAGVIGRWLTDQSRAEEHFASGRAHILIPADDPSQALRHTNAILWLGFSGQRDDEGLASALVSTSGYSGPDALEAFRAVLRVHPQVLADAERFAIEQNRLLDEACASALLVREALIGWLNDRGSPSM